jgi:hypothetical protein
LVVTADGRLWHAVRRSDGAWTSVGDVKGQVGDPGSIQCCAAVGIRGELHIGCVTSDGKLWHSIRLASGNWTGIGDVKSQTGDPGSASDLSVATVRVKANR